MHAEMNITFTSTSSRGQAEETKEIVFKKTEKKLLLSNTFVVADPVVTYLQGSLSASE